MKLVKEVWKSINEFPDYEVSNLGNIRNASTKHVLKGWIINSGYLVLALRKDGKKHNRLVHRIVAKAFISNPNNLPVVNHIDANRINNCASNLEWCTQKDNIHEMQDRVGMHIEGAREALSKVVKKQVYQLDDKGNIINEYPSIQEANLAVHHSKKGGHISRALKSGGRAYGYYWKYVHPENANRGSSVNFK